MTLPPLSIAAYRAAIGSELGRSDWITVDQARIDAFADCTLDHQFIHVDPARAAASPFGGTIAHGFLTLSLLSACSYAAVPPIQGETMTVNYGFNKLRFLTPVRVGRRVRALFVLDAFSERSPGQWLAVKQVTMAIEGESAPALVGEWITLTML